MPISNTYNRVEIAPKVINVLRNYDRDGAYNTNIKETDPISMYGGGGAKNVRILREIADIFSAETGSFNFPEFANISHGEALPTTSGAYNITTVGQLIDYTFANI
jgi:hypothetical protein